MYEFWYDYIKPKHGENAELCYMHTSGFIVHVKTECIYRDIAEDIQTRIDTSNFELRRSLFKGKNKKAIGLMKDKLGGKIMKKYFGLRAKTYSYLKDYNDEVKTSKGTDNLSKKLEFKFQDCNDCLEVAQIESEINHLEKNEFDVVSLEEIQKEFLK